MHVGCARACGSYHTFYDKGLLLASNEAIERMNLRSPSRYGISVSQMTTDMFRLSQLQSPYYWLIIGFLTRVTRRVPLVGQEGLCCSIFRFLCSVLYIIVCPFVPFFPSNYPYYYWLIIGFLTRVTRRVPLVGQEGLCCSIFRFLWSAVYIIVCPFVPFCLAIE